MNVKKGEDALRLLLEPSSSLLWTPPGQGKGLAIILRLIIDGCEIKVRHRAKAHIIRAVLTLQPLSQLFLRTSLTKGIKARASLFIAVFILENGDSLFASLTETIPVFSTGGGTSSETPNELTCGYSLHRHVLSEENAGENTGDCVVPSHPHQCRASLISPVLEKKACLQREAHPLSGYLYEFDRIVTRSESVSAFGVAPLLCASVAPGASRSDGDDELQIRCPHFAHCG
jgi:hypothetical protein